MARQSFTGKITEKRILNEKIILISLRLTGELLEINFHGGQYVVVKISDKISRSYSIYSAEREKNKIQLLIDITPGGPGSLFWQNCQIGQKVNFLGPFGQLVKSDKLTKNIYFISAGTCVAPLRSIVFSFKPQDWQNIDYLLFLYGSSYFRHLVEDEKFRKLAKDNLKFHYVPCVSREKTKKSFFGRVTDYLSQHKEEIDWQNSQFYLCGVAKVSTDVERILKDQKVRDDHIFTEKF